MNILNLGEAAKEPTAVALGIFDGMHRGHMEVIGLVKRLAEEKGLSAAVFTFKTATVTSKGNSYKPIYTDDTKTRLLEEMGIDYLFMADFSQLRDYSGEDFADKVLCNTFNSRLAVCGGDFRMGKNTSCSVRELSELAAERGIELHIADDVVDTTFGRISSAQIRQFIAAGNISDANRLLGRAYSVSGEVLHGNCLGRKMGFPTINQRMDDGIAMPKFGVYVSEAEIGGQVYRGVTNIGVKPTVESRNIPLAETHFPLFCGDLYGQSITVRLYEFLRSERKFEDAAALERQIAADKSAAMEYIITH
ncbi:MAG: bifunctional riboflavin kinase/FAD synthetase [Oscillospiraceae bacterium]|nr:bifunctional riboflavin kinase/FAD synthetase [Oscillospiraceae bacterium]